MIDLNDFFLQNQSLLEENRNVKQQVYILQEQIRKLQSLNSSLSSENSALKKESTDLAQLQVVTPLFLFLIVFTDFYLSYFRV